MPLSLAFTLEVAVLFAMMWGVIRVCERHASNIDGVLVSAIAICVMVAMGAMMMRSAERRPDRIAQNSQPATAR